MQPGRSAQRASLEGLHLPPAQSPYGTAGHCPLLACVAEVLDAARQ